MKLTEILSDSDLYTVTHPHMVGIDGGVEVLQRPSLLRQLPGMRDASLEANITGYECTCVL